jgi:hypothetical protein
MVSSTAELPQATLSAAAAGSLLPAGTLQGAPLTDRHAANCIAAAAAGSAPLPVAAAAAAANLHLFWLQDQRSQYGLRVLLGCAGLQRYPCCLLLQCCILVVLWLRLLAAAAAVSAA